jgi:hypothetical protein
MAEVAAKRGVITRAQALAVVPHHVLDRALAAGALVRLHPRTYVLAELIADDATLDRAAVLYTEGVLSHLSALRCHGLLDEAAHAVRHVTRTPERHPRGDDRVVVHRRRSVDSIVRGGLPVVPLEQAIVESWQMVPAVDRRGVAISAVSNRLTTPGRLSKALKLQPATPGAASMSSLFSLLAAGCRSELELWGHRHVFDHPELAGDPFSNTAWRRRQGPTCSTGHTFVSALAWSSTPPGTALDLSASATSGETRPWPRWAGWSSGSRMPGCTQSP